MVGMVKRTQYRLKTALLYLWLIPAGIFAQTDLQVEVSEWKLIEAIDQSASVFAPETMEVRIDSLETDIGNVYTVHHLLRQSTDISPNFLFQLSYTIYPNGVINSDSTSIIQDILQATVDNAVLLQNGELLYASEKSYKDYPGRIWKTIYNKGAYHMKSEIYFANDHLFMLQVGSLADVSSGKAIDHFFESFKISMSSKRNP